jgi:hypothetical protein
LPVAFLRQRRADLDSAGHLECSQAVGRKGSQLIGVEFGARSGRDHRKDFLAAYLVRDADHRALKYACVGVEHLLDLAGIAASVSIPRGSVTSATACE